jgi:diguanylate cyclase (GGDEF)-like protein
VLGRIGGEEFAAFLVGANDEEAVMIAERIRTAVEKISFQPVEGIQLSLTVSIGGTSCTYDANVSELMRAADLCLYEAKDGGRNRAIFDDSIPAAA